jgi:hypothetical protein
MYRASYTRGSIVSFFILDDMRQNSRPEKQMPSVDIEGRGHCAQVLPHERLAVHPLIHIALSDE